MASAFFNDAPSVEGVEEMFPPQTFYTLTEDSNIHSADSWCLKVIKSLHNALCHFKRIIEYIVLYYICIMAQLGKVYTDQMSTHEVLVTVRNYDAIKMTQHVSK